MSVLGTFTNRCYNLFWRQIADAFESWVMGNRFVGTQSFNTSLIDQPRQIERMDRAAIVLDQRNRIVLANQIARRQFFRGKFFILGQQICSMLPWLANAVDQYTRSSEKERTATYVEDELKRVYEVQFTPLMNHQRELVGRLAVIQEISSNQIIQEALTLAKTKTDLLAKVSHEMRTPLSSILSIGEMLDYGVYGPLSPEQKDAVRVIAECTQTMTRLVNDLLEQSHMEQGNFHLEETEFALQDVVNRLRKSARPKATSKGLWLTFDISPEMPVVLQGDPFRLLQVLQNLVDNAIKYTNTGKVSVRFYPNNGDSYSIQVSDTGMGIPIEMQRLIFEPFRQVHVSETGNGSDKGFGLGLSIVKQLVTLMKGEIHLLSEVGKGSIFTVKLPIHLPVETKH